MEPRPLGGPSETAALVALLRIGARPPVVYADLLDKTESARVILEDEQGLLANQLLDDAAADVARWQQQGIRLISLLDPVYPANLRAVWDRPPLLFMMGRLEPSDARSIAVIGSRRAPPAGLRRARAIAERLVDAGHTIVSGLAAGVDTAAHVSALQRRGRTIAVVGTGLHHVYPPQNAALQQRIVAEGAVLSQFWPEAGPSRQNFPLRNAVMSGLALATVVVEATQTSGVRTQVRAALAQGRPVLLASSLLEQPWARETAARPGVRVFRSVDELDEVVGRISSIDALVA